MEKVDFSCPKCGCENTVKVTPKMFDGTSAGQWVWWGIMIVLGILSGGKELEAGNRWIMKCSRCGNEFLVDNPESRTAVRLDAAKFGTAEGSCAVRLISVPPEKKIATIRAIREMTKMELVEAKALSERTGSIMLSSISEDAANRVVAALRNAGADAVVEGNTTSASMASKTEDATA